MNIKLTIFSFGMLILGLIFCVLVSWAQSDIGSKCVSSQVQNTLNVMLSLSVMMTVLPVVQGFCFLNCDCGDEEASDLPYFWISIIILLMLSICSFIVYDGLKEECSSDTAKTTMLGFGVTSLVALVFLTSYKLGLFNKLLKGSE